MGASAASPPSSSPWSPAPASRIGSASGSEGALPLPTPATVARGVTVFLLSLTECSFFQLQGCFASVKNHISPYYFECILTSGRCLARVLH